MDLTKINPDVLRELLKLSEQKAVIQKQLDAIDARISALSTGKKAAVAAGGKRRGRPAGRPKAAKPAKAKKAPKAPKAAKGGGKRGALKSQIINLLSAAGPEGISVKDISSKLGVKNQNVHVWFSTTGKKLAEIAKVGEARYAFKSPAAAPAAEPAAASF